ncbi:hypothetical protein DFR70_103245 [Nocardia tenerifensis]|uniref:Uncharacterized protein n=1 Tax=Nocardia tenerifensis TaxID=228006 RepID=A0A318K929_9NOCA|nr:hypothetical protein [Nocardia tenerifensis]PXX66496.1 hypothetical protein DFR70_103245 [Nocardia tenerifensis]
MFAPAPLGDAPLEILAESAFGAHPGRAAAELPTASDALGSWYRAVILGGQGRYAAARAELRIVRARSVDPIVLSLAASTEGSLLRQLGWHARAAAFDGRAVALLTEKSLGDRAMGSARSGYPFERSDAIGDALTGLAADALGVGRVALAWRLLRRGADLLPPERLGWRPAIRREWVSAETALAAGTVEPAGAHAAAALELSERAPSVRHLVKSRLLVAAAAAAAGEHDRSRELAERVSEQCREHGLLPLRWASAMLRAGLAVDGAAAEARDCAAAIVRRGGRFRP